MENASKALIIAGAILLAILLISLGIMIFNQAQDTVSNSGMSEAAITSFNNKFLKYEGKQKGTMVKSLIQEVRATNSDSSNKDSITVSISYKTSTGAAAGGVTNSTTPTTSSIKNNNTYTIKMNYGTDGRINNITVTGDFN